MKPLNLAFVLLMSFSLPSHHPGQRVPASEVKTTGVEELIQKALEARTRGDFSGALVILEEARAIEPANLDVGFYIGLTQYNLGKFEEAEKELREVLDAAPLYVDAKIILGRVLIALGNVLESETLLREAVAQTPDCVDAYDALASNLLVQKKNDEAIFILNLGLARKPEEPSLLSKKGKILFIMKRYRDARTVALTLTGIPDRYGRYQGHVLFAKISFEQDPMRIDVSASELQEAITLAPEEAEAYLVLSDVYASLWKFKKARELLETAMDEVRERSLIESKLAQIGTLENDVQKYSVNLNHSQWHFRDGRDPWKEFYLDAVWRIDPYKTLVFGVEEFTRGGLSDETVRVEYVEKVNRWIYLYASAKVTIDPDFREKSALKLGSNFVTNPLAMGPSVVVGEAEVRNYDAGKVYFLTAGVDQYIGESLIINARVFRVLTGEQDFNVWSVKSSWKLTPRVDVSANYGTMTEDVNGRLSQGTSRGVGIEHRVNDRVSLNGSYQRVENDAYEANQVTVGMKVKLGPQRRSPPRRR